MTSIKLARKKTAPVEAGNLAAVRTLVQTLFPTITPASALALRFWKEGGVNPTAEVIYEDIVTAQGLKDIMTAKEQADILDVTP